ncbi:MAG: hypothetical protein HKP14_05760 [Bacteroidia bacterium]|nr:hypothetical protein [Bacteroidia bacterium]
MYRILNIIVFFCLVASSASAQLVEVKEKRSGYLNRYNVVGFRAFVGPSLQPQRAGLIGDPSGFSLNTAISLEVERVMTNYSAIKFRYGLSKTSADIETDLKEEFESYFNDFIFTGTDGLEYRVIGISGTPSIKEISIGFDFKKYLRRRGAIAPLGGYFTIGGASNRVEVDLSPSNFVIRTERNYHDDPVAFIPPSQPLSARNLVKIHVGGGHSTAITDRLILDTGIEFAYMYVGVKQHEYTEDLGESLEYIIYKRMQRKQIANYYVGLSFVF